MGSPPFKIAFAVVALIAASAGAWYLHLDDTRPAGPVAGPEVFVVEPGQNVGGKRIRTPYELLSSSTGPWRIVALFPHMKDSYWHAVDYGMVEHARRLGVNLRILHAGGYENLGVQREQMKTCIQNREADAIVLCAISLDGFNDLIASAKAAGIPVVDSVNGVSSPDIAARSLSPNASMSGEAGRFLAKKHPAGSGPMKLAWLPGPEDAGWVIGSDKAFREGIAGSAVEIVETLYGDTGVKVQGELLAKALDKHPDLDYIACTAVTAEVAPALLRERGLENRVHIIATYINPGVYRHLQRGVIAASMTGGPADLGRIGIDQAVRVLEKKHVMPDIEPVVRMLEPATVGAFDRSHDLAPDNFEPVFTVNATR